MHNSNLASKKVTAKDERGKAGELIVSGCCHATHTRDDGQPLCDDEIEATPYCGVSRK